MPRVVIFLLTVMLSLLLAADAASAQADMKASAPKKMTSPDQKRRMQACQEKAAQQKIAMDQRAKFVMDCMKGGRLQSVSLRV
jgi:hypothetical protein